jgi:hypothetical protein
LLEVNGMTDEERFGALDDEHAKAAHAVALRVRAMLVALLRR